MALPPEVCNKRYFFYSASFLAFVFFIDDEDPSRKFGTRSAKVAAASAVMFVWSTQERMPETKILLKNRRQMRLRVSCGVCFSRVYIVVLLVGCH